MIYTSEQKAIIESCPPPLVPSSNGVGRIFRITAAAGSGKTTTLLGLAKEAIENKGHTSLTYCTFTKAAAKDGCRRLLENGVDTSKVQLEARTLHSLAAKVLNDNDETEDNGHLMDENQFKKWVNQTMKKEINEFLEPCEAYWAQKYGRNTKDYRSQFRRSRQQVEFYLYKTFVMCFCQKSWTLDKFRDPKTFGRVYYPAVMLHKSAQKAEPYGLHVCNNVDNYANMAATAWERALEQCIATHDIRMKKAQLGKYPIPGSIILVDEAQDMDACQVEFCVQNQVAYGKIVYVVGDPAQTIYGFRGAKAENLMTMNAKSMTLTQSWRFGPCIERVANVILYAKQHSPQTKEVWDRKERKYRNKYWDPYRIRAGRQLEGIVTNQQIANDWQNGPVTIIAKANITLLKEALSLLGIEFSKQDDENESSTCGDDAAELRSEDDDSAERAQDAAETENTTEAYPVDGMNFPKIHLYGKGESSGVKGWKEVLKRVQEAYDLYKTRNEEGGSMKLSKLFHPEFTDPTTWDGFVQDCEKRELSKYNRVIHVVRAYGENTLKAMESFEENVMERNVKEEEADIILVTSHSSKGMEWPRVQVCDDFLDLCDYQEVRGSPQQSFVPASSLKRQAMVKYQFKLCEWDNDLNTLYVACTRAKHTLSLPPKFCNLLQELDRVTCFVRGSAGVRVDDDNSSNEEEEEDCGICITGLKETTLDLSLAKTFHSSLIAPLQKELGLQCHQLLAGYIINERGHSVPVVTQDPDGSVGDAPSSQASREGDGEE